MVVAVRRVEEGGTGGGQQGHKQHQRTPRRRLPGRLQGCARAGRYHAAQVDQEEGEEGDTTTRREGDA